MNALRRNVAALLESTEALVRALETGDDTLLATALEVRRDAFEAIRGQDPEPAPGMREVLSRVARLDEAIVAAARRAQAVTSEELKELQTLRSGVRQLAGPEAPPRFVSRRA